MHFAKEDISSGLRIRAYEHGRIHIGEQDYECSVILTLDQVISDWRPQAFDELVSEDLGCLRELQPELVLLGTGSRQHFPDPRLTIALLEAGIGVEIMDTAAACRTYNILLSEQRRVVAALLLR